MRKIARISALVPLIYLIVVPAWFSSPSDSRIIKDIDIVIIDSADYHFVTRRHLESVINKTAGQVIGKTTDEISLENIEAAIISLGELKKAEVFFSIDGTLHVYVDQRDPLLRIIPSEGGDFIMDREGVIFRKRNIYTPRLHIAHGYIDITPAMLKGVGVQDTSIKSDLVKELYKFADYLTSEPYWAAQIDQIYVDRDGDINLIPRMGNHLVHLGSFENYVEKLDKLQALYNDILPVAGWNRYSLINLEFTGQVVCKRRN